MEWKTGEKPAGRVLLSMQQGRLGNEANYVVSEMSNCDACILFAIAIIHEYGVLVWE